MPPLPEAALPRLAMVWAFAEATLFFVAPDVVIAWTAVRLGLRGGLRAVLAALAGATVGGLLLAAVGAADPDFGRALVLAVPAVRPAMMAAVDAAIAADGWFRAALVGALTGVPYKVFAVVAPEHGLTLADLAAMTPIVRLPRFLAVALSFAVVGRVVRRDGRLPRWAPAVYGAGWAVFYVLYWTRTGW